MSLWGIQKFEVAESPLPVEAPVGSLVSMSTVAVLKAIAENPDSMQDPLVARAVAKSDPNAFFLTGGFPNQREYSVVGESVVVSKQSVTLDPLGETTEEWRVEAIYSPFSEAGEEEEVRGAKSRRTLWGPQRPTLASTTARPGMGKLHRVSGPAYTETNNRGTGFHTQWRRMGVLSRLDGPAIQNTDAGGIVRRVEYRVDGTLDRKDGPAIQEFSEDGGVATREEWYEKGHLSRVGAPALTLRTPDGFEYQREYWISGVQHRDDGPAVEKFFGPERKQEEKWMEYGRPSRRNGPAFRQWNKEGHLVYEEWSENGLFHRDSGPAVISYYPFENKVQLQWYHRGTFVRQETRQGLTLHS